MPLQIAILASGRGSNAKAILEAIEQKRLDAEVQCIICNVPGAGVVSLGEAAGIPTVVIPHKGLSREDHEAQVLAQLEQHAVDYLVLAGYMRIMTPQFLKPFQDKQHYRIVNINHSLLPAFPGTTAYEEAFQYGVKVSGVTVHFVDEKMDNGPILLQESFPRLDSDTLEDFKARGLALEHHLYPQALQLLAENKLTFGYNPESERVIVEVKSHVPC